jgi:hypothetical protein
MRALGVRASAAGVHAGLPVVRQLDRAEHRHVLAAPDIATVPIEHDHIGPRAGRLSKISKLLLDVRLGKLAVCGEDCMSELNLRSPGALARIKVAHE